MKIEDFNKGQEILEKLKTLYDNKKSLKRAIKQCDSFKDEDRYKAVFFSGRGGSVTTSIKTRSIRVGLTVCLTEIEAEIKTIEEQFEDL